LKAKIKESIFGSRAEKKLYEKIDSHWNSKGFEVYPNLPFANVIDFSEMELSKKKLDFLYKTSIDYTLCIENKPILTIDFDGLGEGFSKHGKYIQKKRIEEAPFRKLKFDLKLKICKQVNYPYFIVSYDEAEYLDSEIPLTIVDGIIGQNLANKWFKNKIKEEISSQQEYIDGLEDEWINEYIQNLVTDVEVDSSYMWNPIVIKAGDYANLALKLNLVNGMWFSDETLCYPELPHDDIDWSDIMLKGSNSNFHDMVVERMEAMLNITKYGCKYTLNSIYGDIVEICWMNNIEDFGVSAITLIQEIAELLAYKKLFKVHNEKMVL